MNHSFQPESEKDVKTTDSNYEGLGTIVKQLKKSLLHYGSRVSHGASKAKITRTLTMVGSIF